MENIECLNKKKEDFATQIKKIANSYLEYISNTFPDSFGYYDDKINNNVLDLLNADKPKVMVYGIYNSGKSTLINSLCKEEVAEMADRPMTERISEYDKGDYMLIDSPGVDAPIEHEMITTEFLNKCNIILFVISTKGVFEDRYNYEKLAELIKKDIPFIVVLNDRGMPIKKEWSEQKKQDMKIEHDQELKLIQYKVIDNLISVSGDKRIADKYEVIILNAKKALIGISRDKPQLYKSSGVEFLDKRISQILLNSKKLKAIFKQPITNLKECINETEKNIIQKMSGDSSEDFSMRTSILQSKRDNLLQDMRILIQQTVNNHVEELTNLYANKDYSMFETIVYNVLSEVEDRYEAKINELIVYIDHNFKNLNIDLNKDSNLVFDPGAVDPSKTYFEKEEDEKVFDIEEDEEEFQDKKGFFDFLKSRRKREEEKRERLERKAEWINQREEYKVQEKIRIRQEARQDACSDLDELQRMIITVVNNALKDIFDEIISYIQEVDCSNKQLIEEGKEQMLNLKSIRNGLIEIENQIL